MLIRPTDITFFSESAIQIFKVYSILVSMAISLLKLMIVLKRTTAYQFVYTSTVNTITISIGFFAGKLAVGRPSRYSWD